MRFYFTQYLKKISCHIFDGKDDNDIKYWGFYDFATITIKRTEIVGGSNRIISCMVSSRDSENTIPQSTLVICISVKNFIDNVYLDQIRSLKIEHSTICRMSACKLYGNAEVLQNNNHSPNFFPDTLSLLNENLVWIWRMQYMYFTL